MKTLCCLIALTAAPALADTARCAALYAAAPRDYPGHAAFADEDYEADTPGLGWHLSWQAEGSRVSVYFYDGQHATIEDAMVLDAFKAAIGEMHAVYGRIGQPLTGLEAMESQDGAPMRFIAQAVGGGTVQEFLGMGQSGNCLVKLRFSSLSGREAAAESFMAHARMLWPTLP